MENIDIEKALEVITDYAHEAAAPYNNEGTKEQMRCQISGMFYLLNKLGYKVRVDEDGNYKLAD